jgi:hypothetical protein
MAVLTKDMLKDLRNWKPRRTPKKKKKKKKKKKIFDKEFKVTKAFHWPAKIEVPRKVCPTPCLDLL